ncbi:unnamed protein product, partial [Prunus brigantina]
MVWPGQIWWRVGFDEDKHDLRRSYSVRLQEEGNKIHHYGCYHGSLNLKSSYVFVAGHLKLINIEGSCNNRSQDLYELKKRQDFVDMELLFRSLFSLLTSNFRWPEKDAFLNCMLSTYQLGYNEFYFKLRKRPFLLTPRKRLEYA